MINTLDNLEDVQKYTKKFLPYVSICIIFTQAVANMFFYLKWAQILSVCCWIVNWLIDCWYLDLLFAWLVWLIERLIVIHKQFYYLYWIYLIYPSKIDHWIKLRSHSQVLIVILLTGESSCQTYPSNNLIILEIY